MTGFIIMSFILVSGLIAVFSSTLFSESADTKTFAHSYFIGDRTLLWPWLTGSLLLSHISIEQLIIYNGIAFQHGYLSVLLIEIIAVLSMIISCFVVLPRYWASGVITTPEFIGQRFDQGTRKLVAGLFLFAYATILLPLTLLIGAEAFKSIFELSASTSYVVAGLGILGTWYALKGFNILSLSHGIYSVALVFLSLLIPSIALIDFGNGSLSLGLSQALSSFNDVLYVKTSTGLSQSNLGHISWDKLGTGMIVLQLFLWSSHQAYMQRVLGAKTLVDGQKVMLSSALLKLISPFVLCLPAGLAWIMLGELSVVINHDVLSEVLKYNHASDPQALTLAQSILESDASRISLETAEALKPLGLSFGDQVYSAVIRRLLPDWSLGIVAATLFGVIISSFNSILHGASTLFVHEFYKTLMDRKEAISEYEMTDKLTRIGKIATLSLAILSVFTALELTQSQTTLVYLQKINGVWSVPITSVFLIGFINKSSPASFAKLSICIALGLYLFLSFYTTDSLHWLHIYFICFMVALSCLMLGAWIQPQTYNEPSDQDQSRVINQEPWVYARYSAFVLIGTILIILALYAFFI